MAEQFIYVTIILGTILPGTILACDNSFRSNFYWTVFHGTNFWMDNSYHDNTSWAVNVPGQSFTGQLLPGQFIYVTIIQGNNFFRDKTYRDNFLVDDFFMLQLFLGQCFLRQFLPGQFFYIFNNCPFVNLNQIIIKQKIV